VRRLFGSLLLCVACGGSPPSARSADSHEAPDAIVVLGHRPPLDAHGLEYETRARVDRGLQLFLAGRAPWLLFSGGPSTEEAIEADVMAQYAAQHGARASSILRERASTDTIENARMSVALLRDRLALSRRPRVVLVTSDYHIDRASRLFRCAGAEVIGEGVPLELTRAERKKRERSERWVKLYYALIDECSRARR